MVVAERDRAQTKRTQWKSEVIWKQRIICFQQIYRVRTTGREAEKPETITKMWRRSTRKLETSAKDSWYKSLSFIWFCCSETYLRGQSVSIQPSESNAGF